MHNKAGNSQGHKCEPLGGEPSEQSLPHEIAYDKDYRQQR
jgi:hypothetical protein